MSYFFKIAKKAKYFLPTSPHVPFKCCFSCHTKLNLCMEFGKNLDFCIRMFFLKTLSFQACFWKKLIRAFMIFSWYCFVIFLQPAYQAATGGYWEHFFNLQALSLWLPTLSFTSTPEIAKRPCVQATIYLIICTVLYFLFPWRPV